MRTETPAPSLTVWVGSASYTFLPGRDITVGRDSRSDVPLYDVDEGIWTSRTHLLLRFTGTQWVAIDRSRNGTYVNGARVSTVNIRDGQAITVGHPRGPRLTFQLGAWSGTPARPTGTDSSRGPAQPPRRPPPPAGWQNQPTRQWSPNQPTRQWSPNQPTRQWSPNQPTRQWSPNQPTRQWSPNQPTGQWSPNQPPAMPAPQAQPEASSPPRAGSDRPTGPPSQLPTERFRAPQTEPPPAQPAPASTQPEAPPAQPRSSEPERPSQLPTQRFSPAQSQTVQPIAQPAQPPPAQPPSPLPAQPPSAAQPPSPPAVEPTKPLSSPQVAQRKGLDLVERVTRAMRKLLRARRMPRPHKAATTGPAAGPPPHDDRAAQAAMPPQEAASSTVEVQAHQLGLALDGRQVFADVSFTAGPGMLTAVIGPANAAKSALVNTLGGAVQPSSGQVTLDGHDVHTGYESMRSRIGMVPNEDVLHHQLTVEQALGYAAELRLPPDASADDRHRVVRQVLDELKLTSKRMIQVGELSDEQRKRASVAAELLTGPSMLILDEPTAGLDPALKQQTMAMLRRLADAGRVVVVATTSPSYLDMCDQVLLLTSNGTLAFAGPPAGIEAALGATSWSEIFAKVSSDPDRAHEAFLARRQASPPATKLSTAAAGAPPSAPPIGRWPQIGIAARRQAWLIVGDQRYFIFLTILPIFFGALSLVVPGDAGLGPADPYGNSPNQALDILVVLIIGAVFMGTALTIRDLIGERSIYRREHSLGLSAPTYLTAKIVVYGIVAIVQSVILTTAAVVGKGAPTRGGVVLGDPTFELYVTVAATAVVSAIIGLALSSLAKYKQQTLLMFVLVILLSLMFCGGISPLGARIPLDEISWLVPARWGLAASASAVDLQGIDLVAAHDTLWTHSAGSWLLDMAILIVFGVAGTGFLRWRLRLPGAARSGNHTTEAISRPTR